jgi:hypothetical protein
VKVSRVVTTLWKAPTGGGAYSLVSFAVHRVFLGIYSTGPGASTYVSPTPIAAAANGLLLSTSGGSAGGWQFTIADQPYYCSADWYAYSSTSPGTPTVITLEEYLEETGYVQPQPVVPATGLILPSMAAAVNGDPIVQRAKAAIEQAWERLTRA